MIYVSIYMALNKISWQSHSTPLTLSAIAKGSLKRNK